MREIEFEELKDLVGQEVGKSDWFLVDQERINRFADATDDHQWIHVDLERAKAGPFGTAIAHGYLTLSLVVPMTAQAYRVKGVKMGINYGVNRVRFPAPVPAGSKLRATFVLNSVEDVQGGLQCVWGVTIEREGGDKPVCVAESVTRLYS